MTNSARIAIVHDWLDSFGGAERLVAELLDAFEDADMYTVFDLRREPDHGPFANTTIRTSPLNNLPMVRKYYRNLLLLAMRAVEGFDLSNYDAVISSSAAVAKGCITHPDQPHIAYVHTPARYAWSLQAEYLSQIEGRMAGLRRMIARELLHRFRLWDMRTSQGVNLFVANSRFIQRRIWKTYRRRSTVVYPPIDTSSFLLSDKPKENFYVTASRMVPYKRIDLIVEAFSTTPDRRLVVIGDGPEMGRIKKKATPNIEILGYQSNTVMLDLFQRARAFVFAAREDFGIVPVEAQACGTPVIALGQGGTAETIRGLGAFDQPTGVWFQQQTAGDIREAVDRFEQNLDSFDPSYCRANAEFFSAARFKREMQELVEIGLSRGFPEEQVLDVDLGSTSHLPEKPALVGI